MPALTRLLRPWLEPKAGRRQALSVGGLAAIVLPLVGMAAVFRQVTG